MTRTAIAFILLVSAAKTLLAAPTYQIDVVAAWPAEEFLSADRTRFGLAADEPSAVRPIPRAWSPGSKE